jgi:hypothetical protein
MKYLDTAFAQLEFAIKLMQAAEDGRIKREDIDLPLTISEGSSVLVLADQVIHTDSDFINAMQNNVSMAFGAAAITLNQCREEMKISLPITINTELEQWISLVYQIRNAFAHNIAEPIWKIKPKYARHFQVNSVSINLSSLNKQHFNYDQLGGAKALFLLRDYGRTHLAK